MKLICPECCQQVKKCHYCETEFGYGQFIICVGIRGKHFCQEDCKLAWMVEQFENTHTVVETFIEQK